MSHVELIEAQGNPLLYALAWAAFFALLFAAAWFALHGGQYVLLVWRRGRAYRRQLRRAKHRQRRDSLHYLTYRRPVR